jgi:hypothetical protein
MGATATSISAMHPTGSSSLDMIYTLAWSKIDIAMWNSSHLDAWSVCQGALQLQHRARELVSETCLAAVVVGWCGASGCCTITMAMAVVTVCAVRTMCSVCSVGVGGGCSLDSTRSRIPTLETGHQCWLGGASDSGIATAVEHFDKLVLIGWDGLNFRVQGGKGVEWKIVVVVECVGWIYSKSHDKHPL